jgi:hypothetical protein
MLLRVHGAAPSSVSDGRRRRAEPERVEMRARLPLALSAVAVVVAVLGSTPIGTAAREIVPFARKAGFAQRAGTAETAKTLAGHKPTAKGLPGGIPVIDPFGRLPASLGAVGPKGDPGESATRLWALVRADGTLVASRGVAGVKGTRPYVVTFVDDVSACALVATAGAPNPQAVVSAFAVGATAEVHVVTRGTGASTTDGFSLAALC